MSNLPTQGFPGIVGSSVKKMNPPFAKSPAENVYQKRYRPGPSRLPSTGWRSA